MPIEDASCVWLTTLRTDGSPHTAPVWFVVRDDSIWVATSRSAVKVRNLEADPRVSLAVDGTGADPAVAQGRAVIHQPDDAGILRAFAEKYDGWDAADETLYGPRVLLEVPVERWLLRPD